ncbi:MULTISPECIES: hypothetical protein [unclassified Exiguobacterium]|uniref:hypothetical protein n=1 Tax=unclassified Exiguobacterium TaxID=2644629 RepID=UPI001BE7B2C9|nr:MULTISPECIES: hypothetical protein [unclassified Exiguobacterium]
MNKAKFHTDEQVFHKAMVARKWLNDIPGTAIPLVPIKNDEITILLYEEFYDFFRVYHKLPLIEARYEPLEEMMKDYLAELLTYDKIDSPTYSATFDILDLIAFHQRLAYIDNTEYDTQIYEARRRAAVDKFEVNYNNHIERMKKSKGDSYLKAL